MGRPGVRTRGESLPSEAVHPTTYGSCVGFLRRRDPVAATSARAVVVEYWQGRGTPDVSWGESKAISTRFTAIVRLEGATDVCEVSGRLPFWLGWLIVEGDTIGVLVDAGGRPIDFDRAELERQMTPQLGLYEAEHRRRSSLAYGFREDGLSREEFRNAKDSLKALGKIPRLWKDAVFERPVPGGGLDDTDPLLEPIDGVDCHGTITSLPRTRPAASSRIAVAASTSG
jgi:hypothetical protein